MSHEQVCAWLGLPPEAWPPDHYRLLDLEPGESNTDRIEQQVHDKLEVVRCYQLTHPELVTDAMNRLAQAFVCLTDPQAKREYDAINFPHLKPVATATPDTSVPSAPAPEPAEPLAWLYAPEPAAE